MKLNSKQISKIYKKVELKNGNTIVMLDVPDYKTMSPDESNFNIYCIDNQFNIIWQIKEIETKPIDHADMFVNLDKNNKDEITARRSSGFTYKIDPEIGEAEQTGFSK